MNNDTQIKILQLQLKTVGHAMLTVSGDSMLPVLSDGDVVTLKKEDQYKLGDILVYPYKEGMLLTLIEDRGLKPNTLDNVHTVLHQVFEMAVDDDYIRSNPSSNVIREIKQAYGIKIERRKSLTLPEQKLFLDYLSRNNANSHWYPIFAFMLGTGLRVGEVTGLRWCDIDLDEGYVDVNHTLVYYAHSLPGYKEGCYFAITSPKTHSSIRQVPLMDFAREALEQEKLYQEGVGLTCNVTIDETPPVLLPNFSCHNLRHTFTTRMVEAGVNIKVIQDALGHSDISTTMNIYADATKELKKSEFKGLDYVFR